MNADIQNAMQEMINCAEMLKGALLDDPDKDAIDAAKKYAATIQASAERILSLPMRNCDKFRTAREAKDTFVRQGFTVPSMYAADGMPKSPWPSFVNWLFDSVKKKGEE